MMTSADNNPLACSATAKALARSAIPESKPWPSRICQVPGHTHRISELHANELLVCVYDGDDAVLHLQNYPFDEFVVVMSGKAILTGSDNLSHEYSVGDCFLVPKGFTGTYEIRDNFREVLVINSSVAEDGFKALGLS